MPWLLSSLLDALLWLPALLVIVTCNVGLALWGRPLGNFRWLVALYVAMAPFFFPDHGSYREPALGAINTLLTSLAIVSAARLPDWDQAARRSKVNRWTLFFWMSLPVVSLSPSKYHGVERVRAGASSLARALLKRASWMGCAWLAEQLTPLPWVVKSLLVILYFVLNLTAFHDLVVGLCHFAGVGVDELFDSPLLSASPRDFWSRRWNKFINRFALKHVALRIRHRVSPLGTIFVVFLVSGLFHEYFAWGVRGVSRAPGAMTLFFTVQATAVWVGSIWPLRASRLITQPLTFCWMIFTAPLFFIEVSPALLDFSYPASWLPFSEQEFWGWVRSFPPPY